MILLMYLSMVIKVEPFLTAFIILYSRKNIIAHVIYTYDSHFESNTFYVIT